MSAPADRRDHLRLALNGVVHDLRGADAFLTLATWLRDRQRLVGTKIVCSEGDCGACTVLVGEIRPGCARPDPTPAGGRLVYRALDSCITFLYQLDGCHVVTVDALARRVDERIELHPVQREMAEKFGSQCGFCTPGFVMALLALGEEARARGRLLSRPSRLSDSDLRRGLSGNLCRCTGYVQILDAARAVDPASTPALAALFDEPRLVAALAGARSETVRVDAGERSVTLPATWADALAWRAREPQGVVVAGATDLGVQVNKGRALAERILHLRTSVDGYAAVTFGDGVARLGAGARWADVLSSADEFAPELARILELFGAPQIRNAGTVGGNLVNASPIADSLPFFYAAEARVELDSTRGRRTLPIAELYLGYKELDLLPDELLAAVVVPLPGPGESLRLLKVSRRRDLDISTFTAALWLRRAEGRIEAARLALGGVGPTVVRLPAAEARLAGAPFALASFRAAGELAAAEIRPISDVRGSAEYRRLLARNALVHFFHDLGGAGEPAGAAGSAGGAS